MKLTDKVREALNNAFSSRGDAVRELTDQINSNSEASDGAKYKDIGFMNATAVDNTDAVTMDLKIGDLVAVVTATTNAIQTITVDGEFAVAPAIGDLLIAKRTI